MRVVHVSSSDNTGGAPRAAYRLHRALLGTGVVSEMLVHHKTSGDDTVSVCGPERYGRLRDLRRAFHRYRWSNFASPETDYFSRADDHWGFGERLAARHDDLIHLHWLGYTTLTIEEIGRIAQPVVWTLHDMWAFCGAEHCVPDHENARFRAGYHAGNRTPGEVGPDLNRWVWERKRKAWQRPMTIVCPSRWMADCARASRLFRDWPVHQIPNPLDTGFWRPLSRENSREVLGLPAGERIVLFGAMGGEADANKGGDLLREALKFLHAQGVVNLHLAIFGESRPANPLPLPYPVTYLGRLNDDATVVAAYNAADVMVVPSRQDNLPQTAVEAQSCGIPVVAFRVGGLPDIVAHKVSGFLANPWQVESLAEGIAWVVADDQRREVLASAARSSAVEKYAHAKVAASYRQLYEQLLQDRPGR